MWGRLCTRCQYDRLRAGCCGSAALLSCRCRAAMVTLLPGLMSSPVPCMQGGQTPSAACPSFWRTRRWQRCWQPLWQAAAAAGPTATVLAAGSDSLKQRGQSLRLCLAGRLRGCSLQRWMPAILPSASPSAGCKVCTGPLVRSKLQTRSTGCGSVCGISLLLLALRGPAQTPSTWRLLLLPLQSPCP